MIIAPFVSVDSDGHYEAWISRTVVQGLAAPALANQVMFEHV